VSTEQAWGGEERLPLVEKRKGERAKSENEGREKERVRTGEVKERFPRREIKRKYPCEG